MPRTVVYIMEEEGLAHLLAPADWALQTVGRQQQPSDAAKWIQGKVDTEVASQLPICHKFV